MPKNRAAPIVGYACGPVELLLSDTNLPALPCSPLLRGARRPGPGSTPTRSSGLQAKGSTLLLHSIVLSEVLNRYCRIEWNAPGAPSDFERFRGSRAFGRSMRSGRSAPKRCSRCVGCSRSRLAWTMDSPRWT